MITEQQLKQIRKWISSPKYKEIEHDIVMGCEDYLNYYPHYGYETAFETICDELITSKQTGFSICQSIWTWVWVEICKKYGDDYYPKLIKQYRNELSANKDFQ